MRQRKLVIGVLVMLAVLASGFTYAFWSAGVNVPANGTDSRQITIGEGNVVDTLVSLEDIVFTTGVLVPENMAKDSGEVEEVTVSFDVFWENDGLTGASLDDSTTTATLTYSYVVVVKDESNTVITDQNVLDLVVVTPATGGTSIITLDSLTAIELLFTITLTEPGNVTEYNAIANGSIEIVFTFAVTGVTTV